MTMHESGFAIPPTTINLGCGQDFRLDALNIDIDESWSPDAILDLSRTVFPPEGIITTTERFGTVWLMPGGFARIIADNVLSQVADLTTLMTACLALLKDGGTYSISVPHDLSFGAWQDPSHVRAFNERSWLRYSDQFWSLGWDKARFAVDQFNYVPSALGNELRERNVPRDEIVRTPRAIDGITVTLRKIALTADDEAERAKHRVPRARPAGPHKASTLATPAFSLGASSAAMPASRAAPSIPAALALGFGLSVPASVAPAPMPAPARPRPWAAEKDAYCLWIVSPKDRTQQHAFEDLALGLSEAFAARGGSAPIVRHPSAFEGRLPIVLGPHLLSPNMSLVVPPGSILFNTEQAGLRPDTPNSTTLAFLKRFAVLDVSRRNTAALRGAGVSRARTLLIGYAAGLRRITRAAVQDIDVLFYGAPTARRTAVLDDLRTAGLNVVHLVDVYGDPRDAAIGRAKLVLNIHAEAASGFEHLRVSYLLANGVCVVSEGDPADPEVGSMADGLALCPYEGLVPRCLALLADDEARAALARTGFARMSAVDQADHLAALFEPDSSAAKVTAAA